MGERDIPSGKSSDCQGKGQNFAVPISEGLDEEFGFEELEALLPEFECSMGLRDGDSCPRLSINWSTNPGTLWKTGGFSNIEIRHVIT
jgi:hypothetical protein